MTSAPRASQRIRSARGLTPAAQQRRIAREILTKVLVNLGLVGGGLVALMQLLPYYFSQQEKLTALEQAEKAAQARVTQLQQELKQDRHPQAQERIAQEDANLIRPDQRRIVWVKPGVSANSQPEASPATNPTTP